MAERTNDASFFTNGIWRQLGVRPPSAGPAADFALAFAGNRHRPVFAVAKRRLRAGRRRAGFFATIRRRTRRANRYLSLEEARKLGKLDQFAREHEHSAENADPLAVVGILCRADSLFAGALGLNPSPNRDLQ